jgi:hypothetical protein
MDLCIRSIQKFEFLTQKTTVRIVLLNKYVKHIYSHLFIIPKDTDGTYAIVCKLKSMSLTLRMKSLPEQVFLTCLRERRRQYRQ